MRNACIYAATLRPNFEWPGARNAKRGADGRLHAVALKSRDNSGGAVLTEYPDFVFPHMEVLQVPRSGCRTPTAIFKLRPEATLTEPKNILGRLLFEVFPDNPNDSTADGLSSLRASLTKVMKTRKTDTMPILKYAVQRRHSDGAYEERYRRVTNTPILGSDGFVSLIVNVAEDVTALM